MMVHLELTKPHLLQPKTMALQQRILAKTMALQQRILAKSKEKKEKIIVQKSPLLRI